MARRHAKIAHCIACTLLGLRRRWMVNGRRGHLRATSPAYGMVVWLRCSAVDLIKQNNVRSARSDTR
jgi:hypothetical protein